MSLKGSRGIALVENLVAILLVSAMLIGIMGAFFISKVSTTRAKHRMVAMNIIQEYLERELEAGYDGGSGDEGDYYVTVTDEEVNNGGKVVVIDDTVQYPMNGKILPDPYYPYNIEDAVGNPLTTSGVPYKVIGFVVTWQEAGTGQTCTERAVAYVCYHSST